jgi:branched-chain amino acid transport system permease protein
MSASRTPAAVENSDRTGLFRRAVDAIKRHRVLAVTLFLLIFPWLMPYKSLAINVLVLGLYALGFNLMFGYAGALSFGHAAFLGMGAYGCGLAIVHYGVPWFAAIVIGVLLATALALLIGFLATRTRGIYFAMVTLALSQLVYYAMFQARSWTGGDDGLRGVNVRTLGVFGVDLDFMNPTTRYYVIVCFVILSMWVLSRILESPFGAVLEAMRENEARARACGYDVERTRLVAFTLSGAFCGLAGTLYAMHLSIVPIEILHYTTSGQAVMMAILGGMGSFFGPFVGAAALLLIEDLVSLWTTHWQLFVGAIFIVFVLFFPHGIWGTLVERVER